MQNGKLFLVCCLFATLCAVGCSKGMGLAPGGAKDAATFRQNVERGFMPQASDISLEGVFSDYFFNVESDKPCEQLVCPAYATAVSRNPFTGRLERYLAVGLSSNVERSRFARKPLNLVLVLDVSGSMATPFTSYYYDQASKRSGGDDSLPKIEAAKRAIASLLDRLGPEDSFALVLFNQRAVTALSLQPLPGRNMAGIKARLSEVKAEGGTNLEAGLAEATSLLENSRAEKTEGRENRVIVVTDAMPNTGNTDDQEFLRRIEANARKGLYTTVVGVGVDFNTNLTERITRARGANFLSVHDSGDFDKRMGKEFDCLVSPLAFDLRLELKGAGQAIEAVYGSPEAGRSTGQLLRVNTLFATPTTDSGAKGGIVLLKLADTAAGAPLTLAVTYEDREGKTHAASQRLTLAPAEGEVCGNASVRKAILLSRYVEFMRGWAAKGDNAPTEPAPTSEPGRAGLGQWERGSTFVFMDTNTRKSLAVLIETFKREAPLCQDPSLARETAVLEKLTASSAR